MNDAEKPIGVFDSGVGGLTVVRELQALLPNEDIIYLGDTARVPYGSKSAETVERYAELAVRFLLAHDVKLVVIACNTATAFALTALQQKLPLPLIGVIEPGARAAVEATKSGSIGILGTLGTVRSEAYPRAIHALGHKEKTNSNVFAQACPLLVPLAEEGWCEGPIAEAVAREYLRDLARQSSDIDVLVLGCTHYPLLEKTLQEVAQSEFSPAVQLINSASSTALATQRALGQRSLLKQTQGKNSLQVFVTDDARIQEVGARFLGSTLERVAHVDL